MSQQTMKHKGRHSYLEDRYATPTSILSLTFCWNARVPFALSTGAQSAHAATKGNDQDAALGAVFLGLLDLGSITQRN